MEFKKPQPLKRLSDGFDSPANRKKTKLLSTTIATPEAIQTVDDPFDDNFSQFFRSQFIKIPELETSMTLGQKALNFDQSATTSDYNFTQFDGLSQLDSQLEDSIPLGQRCSFIEEPEEDEKAEFTLQAVIVDDEQCEPIENPQTTANEEGGNDEEEAEAEFTVQSSQLFLKELSALQMNISSIVDETLNANKFCTQDFLDPSNDKFEVFKSNVTHSQYLHLKRPNEPIKDVATTPKNVSEAAQNTHQRNDLNTEMIEDELLAQMVMTTQALANNTELFEDQLLAAYNEDVDLDVSERLNECIDPDSSALALLSDEDDKENIENVDAAPKVVNIPDRKENKTPSNVRHTSFRAIQQYEKPNHSPVTASNYYSMGPFFGLPLQVKKLIKTFKNIDDLYSEIFKSNSIFENDFN